MQVIKLNAIDSTNDFLKRILADQEVQNFTVVTAESQTNGKGQMGAKWLSEPGKNLVMSVLLKDILASVNQIFDLNVAIAISVYEALESLAIPKLSIKWPNDIMSDNMKLGGILIENSLRATGGIISIVGIGLNVNQTNFIDLPKASSLAVISGNSFDKDILLAKILERIKSNCNGLEINRERLWNYYHEVLFKREIPMPFEDTSGKRFMGSIVGVSEDGKLQLKLENEEIVAFEIKEIQMLY